MSAFRERLFQLMREAGVSQVRASDNVEKTVTVFSGLKSEFGLDDAQLMRQICFYSRTRHMNESDRITGVAASSTNEYLLRQASIAMLIKEPNYLPLLMANAESNELKLECALAADNPAETNLKARLELVSRISHFYGGYFQGSVVNLLKILIANVLTTYPKKRGDNYTLFNNLYRSFQASPRDNEACLLAFVDAVEHLQMHPGGGAFKAAFDQHISLPDFKSYEDFTVKFRAPGPMTRPDLSGDLVGDLRGGGFRRVFDVKVIESAPLMADEAGTREGRPDEHRHLIVSKVLYSKRFTPSASFMFVAPDLPLASVSAAGAGVGVSGWGTGAAAGGGGAPLAVPSAPSASRATSRETVPFLQAAEPVPEELSQVIAERLKRAYCHVVNSMMSTDGNDDHIKFNPAAAIRYGSLLLCLKQIEDTGDLSDLSDFNSFHNDHVKTKLIDDPLLGADKMLEGVFKDVAVLQSRYEATQVPAPS